MYILFQSYYFKHSFQDLINALCNFGQDIEFFAQFFLHCPFSINERRTLLSLIRSLIVSCWTVVIMISHKCYDSNDFWISKSEFSQQFFFNLLICSSYFILLGTFQYLDIWRLCNFLFVCFLSMFYVKWGVNIYSYQDF